MKKFNPKLDEILKKYDFYEYNFTAYCVFQKHISYIEYKNSKTTR